MELAAAGTVQVIDEDDIGATYSTVYEVVSCGVEVADVSNLHISDNGQVIRIEEGLIAGASASGRRFSVKS